MKKLFTLIAAALFAANVSADEVTLWENVTDGQVLNIADIEAAGGADADIVTFYLEDNTGTDHNGWGMGGYGPSSGWGTDFPFTGNGTSWREETTVGEIKSLAGTDPGVRVRLYNGAELKKVTLQPSITYGEAQTITVTDGFIPASEFAGLSDAAIIEFTYKVEGDITGYVGWGIGRIGSNDDTGEGPSVEIASLPAKALGEAVYKCKMIDIKPALVASPDGILVSFWGFGDGKCTASLVKVEAFDVVSGEEPAGATYMFGGITADMITIDANGEKSTTTLDEVTIPSVNYTGTGDYMNASFSNMENVKLAYKNGSSKNNIYKFAEKFTQVDGKNGVIIISGLKADDVVSLFVSAKGGTPAKFEALKGCTADAGNPGEVTKAASVDEYVEVKFTATDSEIQIKETSGGFRISKLLVNGGATGIQETVAPVKVINNGAIYNLAGQKVNENYKGIVIKNGKKFIQK